MKWYKIATNSFIINGPFDGSGHMTTDEPSIIFEAKSGDEPIGYILVVIPENKNPYIGQVTVKPENRLKGVATALYNRVDSYLREKNKLPLKPSRDLSPGSQKIWDKRLRNGMTREGQKNPNDKKNKSPWEMTQKEYLDRNYTGNISSRAYESYQNSEGLSSFISTNRYTKLIKTLIINNQKVDIRLSIHKNKYVKRDENDEILRSANNDLIYLTDKEIKEYGYPLYDIEVAAFVGNRPVGFASDEWGTSGVWVINDFQRQGLGKILLETLHRFNPHLSNKSLGQMTVAGWNLARSYHRDQVKKALENKKNVPQHVIEDYEKNKDLK